jgi:hypothetical protein
MAIMFSAVKRSLQLQVNRVAILTQYLVRQRSDQVNCVVSVTASVLVRQRSGQGIAEIVHFPEWRQKKRLAS